MKKFIFLILFIFSITGCTSQYFDQDRLKSVTKKVLNNPEKILDYTVKCNNNQQIEKVYWKKRTKDNKTFISAFIIPTKCGRSGLYPEKAWKEFLDKVPNHKLWNKNKITESDSVYQSMKDQFICHWVNPKAQLERSAYKIEPHRENIGLLETYKAECNKD
jgi:Protein of unknown function (DUF2599)